MTSGGTRAGRRGPAGVLPDLTPLLVVDDKDVEELIRSARADLAKLSLELRALQREAATAREALTAGDAEPSLDLAGAQELLRTGVEARLARRRVERRAEIERAQREASRRIADAEAEASALVDAARAELLRALAGSSSTPHREPYPTDDSEWRPRTDPVPPALPSPPPAPPVMDEPQPPSPPRPVLDEAPASPPDVDRAPPSPPLAVAEVTVFAAPSPRPAGRPGRGVHRNWWQGLLHLDVLLPLLAVLIVAVVLLAWVA